MKDTDVHMASSNIVASTSTDPRRYKAHNADEVEAGVGRSLRTTGHETTVPATASTTPEPTRSLAPMRNLYAAAMSYNGYTITDGALRLVVLLNANELGFNAIEIAFMFTMYEVRTLGLVVGGGAIGRARLLNLYGWIIREPALS